MPVNAREGRTHALKLGDRQPDIHLGFHHLQVPRNDEARLRTPGRVGCAPGLSPANVQHCTWLGSQARAASGAGACRRWWRMKAGGASGIARSGQKPRLCEFPGREEAMAERPGEQDTCAQAGRMLSRNLNLVFNLIGSRDNEASLSTPRKVVHTSKSPLTATPDSPSSYSFLMDL